MTDYIDIFNIYIMGNAQVLTGFYFLNRFLQKKVKIYFYIIFAFVWTVLTEVIPAGRTGEFLIYILLLVIGGIFICHAEWKQVMLYSALTVEIMQLSYGMVNSLLGILYPVMHPFNQKAAGIIFMLAGHMASLLLAVLCYYITNRYFSYYKAVKKQYILMILTPVLMLFLMGEYVNSINYSNAVKAGEIVAGANHYEMFAMQFLGMASLFCIMFAYKKLLQNFRLGTELSLLEQEEHFLNRYVEEARARYEKTKSFRHDIKNHIMVVKELL